MVTDNVTLVVGWVSRTTVNVSAVPDSVGAAVVLETVMPADWATAAMGQAMSSVESIARRVVARLVEVCRSTLVCAISELPVFQEAGAFTGLRRLGLLRSRNRSRQGCLAAVTATFNVGRTHAVIDAAGPRPSCLICLPLY